MFWELDENKIYWDHLRIESCPLSIKLKRFTRYLDHVGGRECAEVDLVRGETKPFSLKNANRRPRIRFDGFQTPVVRK